MSDGRGFFGRDAELRLLMDAFDSVCHGAGRTVVVTGPSGIGKTSLIKCFTARATARDAVVSWVSGHEDETHLSFGVIDQLFVSAGRHDAVLQSAAEIGSELALLYANSVLPVVLVIDDAQWADHSSLQAFSFALRRLTGSRVMAIVIGGEETGSALPGGLLKLVEDASGCTLKLSGLHREALADLLEPAWGVLSSEQLMRVHRHTAGNPLHALSLAVDLDAAELGGDLDGPMPVPASMATLILARLAALAPDTRALVAAVSVLGLNCSLQAAVALSGIADVDAALREAGDADILERNGPRGIRFRHAMVRSAIYLDLGGNQALHLHARAAEVTVGPDSLRHRLRAASEADEGLADEAERMADALARSGAWSEAAEWLEAAVEISATRRAAERRRWTAALYRAYGGATPKPSLEPTDLRAAHPIRLLVEGMSAVEDSQYGDGRTLLLAAWDLIDPALDPDTASRIALRMSDCLHGQMKVEEALTWARRAVDVLPTGRDLLGEDPLTNLTFALLGAGDGAQAVELVAQQVPPGRSGTVGLFARGLVGLFTDRLGSAMLDLSDAADRYRRVGPPHKYVEATCMLAETCYRIGMWDAAARHAQEAIVAASVRAIPQLNALALAMSVGVNAARGESAVAEEALAKATDALALRGSYEALAWSWVSQARLEAARDNPQGVVDALSTIAALSKAMPVTDNEGMMPWRGPYALALIQLGRLEEAKDQADRLTKLESTGNSALLRGVAARVRGDLAGARGDLESGIAELNESSEIFETVFMPFEGAKARAALGAQLRRSGQRKEASIHLEAARAVFARLGASPFVTRCDAELASCGLRRQQSVTGATQESLTPAETAVAQLVAGGATNKQVADSLSVSVRTVEHHLRRTYAKLGVGSRSQLAALFGQARQEGP